MALTRGRFAAGAAVGAALAGIARPASAAFGDASVTGTETFGVVAPFTGDYIRQGEQMANGVRQAIDDANLFRGSFDRAYTLRTFDDQNLLATGLVNAEFACDDPTVISVIGHYSGRITEAAMQTYINNKTLVICPASSYDRLTEHGYGNILRLVAKDSTEGRRAAEYVVKNVKPAAASAAVLYQDGDYGADVADGFGQALGENKIKVTPVSFSWDKPKYDDAATAAMAAKPDVVYLAGTLKDMGPMLSQLRGAGYTGPLYASQGFFDAATIQKFAGSAEGLTVSSSMPPLAIAPGAFRIKSDFERRYGAFTPLSAFSYAAAQILITLVRRTGAQDRIAVLRSLTSSSTFETVVGPITFQNDGDPQEVNVYFYRVVNGAWKYVGSALPSSFVVK